MGVSTEMAKVTFQSIIAYLAFIAFIFIISVAFIDTRSDPIPPDCHVVCESDIMKVTCNE
jgi:hypothetical protein